MCEIDVDAEKVLRRKFPHVDFQSDLRDIKKLPKTSVITAGFPCQNLSLVGNNQGIEGRDSRIVQDLFRLLDHSPDPDWLVLENVPFMLWQRKGEAIKYITQTLEYLGFNWAYRVIDLRAFGLPQRRRRVIILASRTKNPSEFLFSGDYEAPSWIFDDDKVACGFSWTEGRYGLGWAPNCVPTIKGGSRVGVPSPPAIWFRSNGLLATPNLNDAERLQGLPAGYTMCSDDDRPIKAGTRWRLVGNAIPVPMAYWIATALASPAGPPSHNKTEKWEGGVWPNAAFNTGSGIRKVKIGEFPESNQSEGIEQFLQYPVKPLSSRAALGFLRRAQSGKLRFQPGFLDAVSSHISAMSDEGPSEAA
jgi:DNA (cytosine-5)-methyltransferase 1